MKNIGIEFECISNVNTDKGQCHVAVFNREDGEWDLYKSDEHGNEYGYPVITGEANVTDVFLEAKELQIPTWSIIKVKG